MEKELLEAFRAYVAEHNPELLLNSTDEYPVSRHIRERVGEVVPLMKYLQDQGKQKGEILDLCMNELTKNLRPSRTDYIREVIRVEFPQEHFTLSQDGTLTYHAVQLLRHCDPVFESHNFNEHNRESDLLRHGIIAEIHTYLTGLGI